MSDGSRRADPRIPITLLTGFLGSGKTTLLNHLIAQEAMAKTAIIVNEFGAVGIDHLLIAKSSDDMVELSNGCLCCTIRSDLVHTLFGLYAAAVNGQIRAFDRVIIETTGLAEPAPILLTLFTDEAVARRFTVNGVVTVVDAVNGATTLNAYGEARHQAAAADLICLSKCDIAAKEIGGPLREKLAILNPCCQLHEIRNSGLDATHVLDLGARRAAAIVDELAGASVSHAGGCHTDVHAGCHHDPEVFSRSLVLDDPVPWAAVLRWIDATRRMQGSRLLRMKGILDVAEHAGRPLVVHAVQQVFHPPQFLEKWPSADRRSRVVVIAEPSEDDAIAECLKTLQAAAPFQ